jgi:hypothetical protein
MNKLALVAVLALLLGFCGCGTSTSNTSVVNTTANGTWEATLTGGSGNGSLLNFVTQFTVTDQGPLNITSVAFFNVGPNACFTTGMNQENETGSANFGTNSNGTVVGTLSLTINSVNPAGNTLTLTGTLTGTSNGTTTTTGVLSNGVVSGTWTLKGGAGCTGQGDFLLCQGTDTCTPATT